MPDDDWKPDLDLGDEHSLKFFSWKPDRTIEANRIRYDGVPDVPKAGAIVRHRSRLGEVCEGAIQFDGVGLPVTGSRWVVESWEPLTLSPSLLCKAVLSDGRPCDDHGFIRDGRWVRA